MNFQQLEYIVAVERHRHFVTAAEHCYVTQATLSMMIKKLEEELNTKIFDRSKQPVVPTENGTKIIEQAKVILKEAERLKSISDAEQVAAVGELRVGIIPTLAPYLLPLFLKNFLKNHPKIKLQISELTTDVIIERIKHNQLDAGILAIPLSDPDLVEKPLFTEEFVIYSSQKMLSAKKKYLLPTDLDPDRLWLLEEGHCLRNQVINLCELKLNERNLHQFDLSASSIETLKKVVEMNEGITILPQLSLSGLNKKQLQNTRQFKSPVPVRQIGLICFRYFVKEKLLAALSESIITTLPESMLSDKGKMVIDI
ncbi:MAG: LysR family transcriptional regulator [Chitinophagales bacterium]|nr:LysR family transcriptional regulator [Chitinophagales bacterium]